MLYYATLLCAEVPALCFLDPAYGIIKYFFNTMKLFMIKFLLGGIVLKKYRVFLEIGFLLIVLLSGCASTSSYGTSGVVQDDSFVDKYLSDTKKEGGILQRVKNSISASSQKYEQGNLMGAFQEVNPVPYTLEKLKESEGERKKMSYLERLKYDAMSDAILSIF
ncbi:hypothetical protein KKHLCK_10445 [Candidatus Electrothrix laxa]